MVNIGVFAVPGPTDTLALSRVFSSCLGFLALVVSSFIDFSRVSRLGCLEFSRVVLPLLSRVVSSLLGFLASAVSSFSSFLGSLAFGCLARSRVFSSFVASSFLGSLAFGCLARSRV